MTLSGAKMAQMAKWPLWRVRGCDVRDPEPAVAPQSHARLAGESDPSYEYHTS
eukprot:COSAG05_NODE_2833_length_2590_cov_1.761943_1_plen_53_part_00